MSVLTFHGRGAGEPEICSGDWTRQELADFYRAHRLLVQNGVDIGFDRGLSDDGDPWTVFFDAETQDVFLHVARIDGMCVLVSDALDIHITEISVAKLVATFEASIIRAVSTRVTRNSNVIFHPVTRLLIAISAVFLVFKLENGVAYAKGVVNDHGSSAADGSRKYDSLIAHRAASTIQRLYELVDSPAVVAAAASVLVTIEISKILPPVVVEETIQVSHEAPHPELVTNLELAHDGQPAHMQVHLSAHTQELPISLDLQSRMPIEAHADELDLPAPSVQWHPPQMWLVVKAEDDAAVGRGSAASAVNTSASSPGSAKASEPDACPNADERPPAESKADLSALELVKAVLAQVEATAAGAAFASNIYSAEDEKHDMAVDAGRDVDEMIGQISLRNLDGLSTTVGFHYESSSEGDKLIDALAEMIEQFGTVDIEYEASNVLIEQGHIEDAPAHSVGLWTNFMSDGSRISVVGNSDIVDDVLGAGLAAVS